jgi:type I restriction enzyme M protein
MSACRMNTPGRKLKPLKGAELEGHYVVTLRELAKAQGMLGQIFTKSQNKIQDPANFPV